MASRRASRTVVGASWVVGLAIAVLLLDARPFLPRVETLTGNHDNATFNYPLRLEAARQWASGRWPLWNPYNLAGAPLLADVTAAVLYPFNAPFLLDLAGPRHRALDRVAALHFVLAALFMYGFGRTLALGRPAAALAGLVFAGNGTLLLLTSRWIQTQNAAVWLPLVLTAIHAAARPRRFWLWVAVGAVAVAMQILSGYPQYVFYTGLVAGAWALTLAPGRAGAGWRPIAAVAAIYALGAALSAVQLLPTLELVATSRRGGTVSLREFLQLSASPNVLAGLAVPRALAAPIVPFMVAGAAFVGTLAAVLAVEGARSVRRVPLFLSVTLIVTFLLAIGPWTPVGWISYQVPGLNAFRYPFKHLLEVTFCLAALAGFGAQSLLDRRRGARICVAVVAALACVWLALVMLRGERHWAVLVSAATTLVFLLLVVARRRRAAIALALLAVWLGLAGNREAVLSLLPRKPAQVPPAAVQTLAPRAQSILGPRYVAAVWPTSFQIDVLGLLALDYPTEFRVPAVHGTSPFLWTPLAEALRMTDDGTFARPRYFHDAGDQTWEVLAVKYFGWTRRALPGKAVQTLTEASIAERATLPPLRFVDRAECAPADETLRELHRRRRDLSAVALVDCTGRPEPPALGAARFGSEIVLVEGQPGLLRMRARVRTARPGMMVISQADVPGWHASIDGSEVPLYRAYGVVQAIVVPPGAHDVRLEYRPRSVADGVAVSVVALAALLIVAAVGVRASRGVASTAP